MEALCGKCSAHVSSTWKFCPHCGETVSIKSMPGVSSTVAEKAPAQGAFSGLLLGMLVVPMLLIVGTMLCLTGLGAFLGVPMIAAGIFAPLLGPMLGLGAVKGKCPWCGASIGAVTGIKGFYCHACSKKIVIADRKFVKVDE